MADLPRRQARVRRATASKRQRLQAAGWKVGDARSFLKLSSEEAELVEMKLALADHLRRRRRSRRVSQVELADELGSSQSRVAKMEAGDGSVSLDLLVKALLALGETPRGVARVLGPARGLSGTGAGPGRRGRGRT